MTLERLAEYRGISIPTLEMAGVYWHEDSPYNVRIPYPNYTGIWYERKALDPDVQPTKTLRKIMQPTGAPPHLYNPLRLGPNAGLTFFCEGEYDTLSVIDCGFDAVGTQGTSTFNKTWARLFEGAVNVIAFDGDSAGRKAAQDLRSIFRDLGNNALIMDITDEIDVNDMHKAGVLAEYLWDFVTENDLLMHTDGAYSGGEDG